MSLNSLSYGLKAIDDAAIGAARFLLCSRLMKPDLTCVHTVLSGGGGRYVAHVYLFGSSRRCYFFDVNTNGVRLGSA
jgi:hypothetical protein